MVRFLRFDFCACTLVVIDCQNCRRSIAKLKRASVREWYSAECGAGRRKVVPARFLVAAGYVAEEKTRSRADVAGAVTDRGLVLPPKLSGAGQWQRRVFSGGEGLALASVEQPAVPWAGFDVVFYDEHGGIVAEASSVPVVPRSSPDWQRRSSSR